MALVAREASGLDFLETLGDDGGVVVLRHRRHFGLHCRQVDGGAAITARDETGRLVCIGGLYDTPAGAGYAEAWFAAGAGFRANAVAAVRALRRYFETIGREAAPLTAVAYVRPEGVAGERLAAWLGFEDDGLEQTAFGLMRRFIRRFEA